MHLMLLQLQLDVVQELQLVYHLPQLVAKHRQTLQEAKQLQRGREPSFLSKGELKRKRSIDIYALLMDAQIKSSTEECASSMVPVLNDAKLKDVQNML
jgi:hypothetical protein